jgi:hypothetical protein
MKLKDLFCVEAVKLGAIVSTFFNAPKFTLTINDDFTNGVALSDDKGNSVIVPYANIKHFSPEVELVKEKPNKK